MTSKPSACLSPLQVYGTEKIEQEVSSYYRYLADEIRGIYRGMMIAIPPPEWQVFEQMRMSLMELTQVLQDLASRVNLTAFVRHPRAQKETRSRLKRHRPAKRLHISTAKILSQAQTKKTDTLKGLVLTYLVA